MRFYPHELSGGMLQRAMIAMAIICQPSLLIADEPTTALDVTIAQQILRLLRRLQREQGFGVFFISHDLDLVERLLRPDRGALRRSRRRDGARPRSCSAAPRHPYTRALLEALPGRAEPGASLPTVPGAVPGDARRRSGMRRSRRAARSSTSCACEERPPLDDVGSGQRRGLPSVGCPVSGDLLELTGRREGVSGSRVRPKARLDPRGRRRRPRDPAGPGVRPRRRVGLRKDDRRPLCPRADAAVRGVRSSSTELTSPRPTPDRRACDARSSSSSSSRWRRSIRG